MDFNIPPELSELLKNIDRFIDQEIKPLQAQDDNERFFDHRREWARTDFENQGLPRPEWEALLQQAKKIADKAGFYRMSLPKEFGGQEIGNLWMSVIRDHLAAKGLGLFNDLQNEHSVVGNFPIIVMLRDFGTPAQKEQFIGGQLAFKTRITFGLTEPNHGSDATHMETKAIPQQRDGVDGWLINGEKMWTTGMHTATHCALFARTSGKAGDARGITCFLTPTGTPGVKIEEYLWTFNMPTDHPRVSFTDVWVPATAMFGEEGRGLPLAQSFVHENRIRQAASSLGAAAFCVAESVKYARERKPFGEELARNQGIQFPLAEAYIELEAASLMRWRACEKIDARQNAGAEANMAKYLAAKASWEAGNACLQTHGGFGFACDYDVERKFRETRLYQVAPISTNMILSYVGEHLLGLPRSF